MSDFLLQKYIKYACEQLHASQRGLFLLTLLAQQASAADLLALRYHRAYF
jgi:hypothetical protein